MRRGSAPADPAGPFDPLLGIMRSIRTLSDSPRGRLVVPLVGTIAWLLLWAAYDFAVVGVTFGPDRCPGCSAADLGAYWLSTWYVLFPIATILAFRTHAWLPIAGVWLGGWEDLLFYWIQGKGVPASTPWILLAPTAELLYLKAGFVFVACAAGHILQWRRRRVPMTVSSEQDEPR